LLPHSSGSPVIVEAAHINGTRPLGDGWTTI